MDERPTAAGGATGWPAGWYADPQGQFIQRWWDGMRWTEHVVAGDGHPSLDPAVPQQPLAPAAKAESAGHLSRAALGKVRTAASGVGERALELRERVVSEGEGSALGKAIATTGQVVAQQLTDPARRAVVLDSVAPVVQAAADGAGLRNKKGKVKVWRVMRAATRPRKSVKQATMHGSKAAATAASAATRAAADRALASRLNRAPDGMTDGDIAREWTQVDATTAVDAFYEGLARFDATEPHDRVGLRASAALMCCGLAYCLVGDPLVPDEDAIITATGKTLSASLLGNDRASWTDADERHVRLALAIARRYGVQPEELGGNGELAELFEEPHDRMAMAMAMSPGGWSCDLKAWFFADHTSSR